MRHHLLFIFIAILLFLKNNNAVAQQDPQFSQYFLNPFVYNPAYAGIENNLSATAHFRTQWLGIEGNPVIENISIHSPVDIIHSGAGIQILNEQVGALRNTAASLSYSYILKTQFGKLSLGINGGVIQETLDGNKLRASEGDYTTGIDHNDPLLSVVSVSGMAPDFSAGLFFKNNKISSGLSATHLIPMKLDLKDGGGNLEINFERQYYFQFDYITPLSKSIEISPAVNVKSNGSLFQIEADILLVYNKLIWIGGG
ncbi:MAG: PorP/SprF family type IX secretion system membrane protein, partial [Ignavibacteria bacterium]|nr:PorP/SprF family type IX secretion system membrane protein [Ignavibacteria bacterium]